MNRVKKVTVQSTSIDHAVCSDIILRETGTTKLIFRPEIVSNKKNPEASVRGTFIFQKKKPSGDWDDYKTMNLSQLKDGEWIKLELHADEVLELAEGLNQVKLIYDKSGIPFGRKNFVLADEDIGIVAEQLANLDNAHEVIRHLRGLHPEILQNLNTVVGVSRLRNALKLWKKNANNSDEEFWQGTFRDNSWLIAQTMLHPVVIFEDKAFVGGKGIENTGGKIPDFLFKNKLTSNVLILEIKTPLTDILGSKYGGTYSISKDLTGTINQILEYKHNLQNNFYSLVRESEEDFEAFDPKCVIITGKLDEIDSREKQGAFMLFRSQFKNIEIITYDELFEKTQALFDLLTDQIEESM